MLVAYGGEEYSLSFTFLSNETDVYLFASKKIPNIERRTNPILNHKCVLQPILDKIPPQLQGI